MNIFINISVFSAKQREKETALRETFVSLKINNVSNELQHLREEI